MSRDEGVGTIDAVGASAELVELDAATAPASPWRLVVKRVRGDGLAMASLAFLALLLLVALAAPLVVRLAGVPVDVDQRDTGALDPLFSTPTGPSSAHPFGVDELGRDVLARTVYGARISLLVALASTAIATVLGVVAGLVAGYFRGWVDTLISRTMDVLLAIPYLLLATGIAATCSLGGAGCFGGAIKPGLGVVIFVIAITSWTSIARIVRGQVLSLREQEFVEAARSYGASDARIVLRELLPNLTAPIVVFASLLIPQTILYEAALSYLGVGASGQPSWGQMISDAAPIFKDAWWYLLFPGLALLFTVLAFNLIGDALQDALAARTTRTRPKDA